MLTRIYYKTNLTLIEKLQKHYLKITELELLIFFKLQNKKKIKIERLS